MKIIGLLIAFILTSGIAVWIFYKMFHIEDPDDVVPPKRGQGCHCDERERASCQIRANGFCDGHKITVEP